MAVAMSAATPLVSFCSHLFIPHSLIASRFCNGVSAHGRMPARVSGSLVCLCSMAESYREQIVPLNRKPERKFIAETDPSDTSDAPSHGEVERDYIDGKVALIGKANVGKSTLLNQLLGGKLSIVTEKPQTTRHCIPAVCRGPSYQIKFYDTPGILSKRMHKLDEMMVLSVKKAILDADCLIFVVDICKPPEQVLNLLEEVGALPVKEKPKILLLNMKDRLKPGEIAKKKEWYKAHGGVEEVLTISAKFGHGIEELKSTLVEKLPFRRSYYPKGMLSEYPEKFFVAELVRENIYSMYRQDVPYSCQVNVVKYRAKAPSVKDFIEVEILVEKESQKAVLIGKGGQMLKELASASRLNIQEFLRKEIYVEIKVKLEEDWRTNEALLARFGYGSA